MGSYVLAAVVVLAVAALAMRFARRGFASVDLDISDVSVQDPDGQQLRLGDLIERPTVLVMPRYYG